MNTFNVPTYAQIAIEYVFFRSPQARSNLISGSGPVWLNIHNTTVTHRRYDNKSWERDIKQKVGGAPRQNRSNSFMIGRLSLQLQLSVDAHKPKYK